MKFGVVKVYESQISSSPVGAPPYGCPKQWIS